MSDVTVSLSESISISDSLIQDASVVMSEFSHRKRLFIDAGSISGSHVNFPVLIHLENLAEMQSANGYDIEFRDEDGAKLDCEIDTYDAGELYAWVRMPTLDDEHNVTFYLYYGKDGVEIDPSTSDVWDDNYIMVQHMNDATTSTILDSTDNDNDGSKTGANEPVEVSGKIGLGQDFDGGNDIIGLDTPASLMSLTYPYTLSAWVKYNNISHNSIILSLDVTDSNSDYAFGIYNTANTIMIGTNTKRYGLSGISNYITANNYYLWSIQFNSPTDFDLFLNGDKKTLVDIGTYFSHSGNCIGARIGAHYTNGKIDEVRISNIIRSADWIATEYANQNDPDSFVYDYPAEALYKIYDADTENASVILWEEYKDVHGPFESIGQNVETPLSDNEAIGDSLTQDVETPLGETETISDSLTNRVEMPLSETITISDSLTQLISLTLSELETITDDDVESVSLVLIEAVAIVDAVQGGGQFTLSDSISILDSPALMGSIINTDSITIKDKVKISGSLGKILRSILKHGGFDSLVKHGSGLSSRKED